MSQAFLYDEIVRLPLNKIGKALSYVRYLEQEPDEELFLDTAEESELHALRTSGNFTDALDLLSRIKELPDD